MIFEFFNDIPNIIDFWDVGIILFFLFMDFFSRKINLSKLGKKFSQSHDSPRKLQHSTKIK